MKSWIENELGASALLLSRSTASAPLDDKIVVGFATADVGLHAGL